MRPGVLGRHGQRGVHFSDVPPGQAKYVTCISGAVLDVVLDVRADSPTYGSWDAVLLDDVERRGIFIGEGLAHGFMALADASAVVYLCSSEYAADRDHGVHPLDPAVGIEWPTVGRDGRPIEPMLSPKDAAAPLLADVAASGELPTMPGADPG